MQHYKQGTSRPSLLPHTPQRLQALAMKPKHTTTGYVAFGSAFPPSLHGTVHMCTVMLCAITVGVHVDSSMKRWWKCRTLSPGTLRPKLPFCNALPRRCEPHLTSPRLFLNQTWGARWLLTTLPLLPSIGRCELSCVCVCDYMMRELSAACAVHTLTAPHSLHHTHCITLTAPHSLLLCLLCVLHMCCVEHCICCLSGV